MHTEFARFHKNLEMWLRGGVLVLWRKKHTHTQRERERERECSSSRSRRIRGRWEQHAGSRLTAIAGEDQGCGGEGAQRKEKQRLAEKMREAPRLGCEKVF
jgi:hypothetical protein